MLSSCKSAVTPSLSQTVRRHLEEDIHSPQWGFSVGLSIKMPNFHLCFLEILSTWIADLLLKKRNERKVCRKMKKKIMETMSLVSAITEFVLFRLEKTW